MTDENTTAMDNAELPVQPQQAVQKTEPKGTSLAKNEKDKVGAMFDRMRSQWGMVLPKTITPDRFARVALSQVRRNPKLAAAIATQQGQLSLMDKLMTCATIGIEPDGRLAHLIPYKNEVTLIIDYKGLVQLAMASGKIAMIHADKVCEEDEFYTSCGEVTHKVNYRKPRKDPYAYYCVATFKDGAKKSEVMTKDEVDAIRNRSMAKNSGPWCSDYDEMAKKTVFRRLSKWLPLTPEAQEAIYADDDVIDTTAQDVTPSGAFLG